MAIRIVRLWSARLPDEGLRIGTVRHPPRGVRKEEIAARGFYDVWLPELAPSSDLVKIALAAETDRNWSAFVRKYRAEMKAPDKQRLLELLAALSRRTDFSIGCYCADERRCHRLYLGQLLADHGAVFAGPLPRPEG